MTFVRQKNTGETVIVVIGNSQEALALHPELFEGVEGEAPEDAEWLNFVST
jgi:hypothetical protein